MSQNQSQTILNELFEYLLKLYVDQLVEHNRLCALLPQAQEQTSNNEIQTNLQSNLDERESNKPTHGDKNYMCDHDQINGTSNQLVDNSSTNSTIISIRPVMNSDQTQGNQLTFVAMGSESMGSFHHPKAKRKRARPKKDIK